jgi:hypothetical protein
MNSSVRQSTHDERVAAVSIPMTMVTGLFVNLLSQEWHVAWPISVGTLVILGFVQFLLLRRVRVVDQGTRLSRVSEQYLVGVAVTAVIGYISNWVADGAWDYEFEVPVFFSSNWAFVCLFTSALPWLMARAGRPSWMWTTALLAGFLGAQFATLSTHNLFDQLGWWLFATVVIWLTTSTKTIFRSIRELASKDAAETHVGGQPPSPE